MASFQVLSDIHLERRGITDWKSLVIPVSDNLILAGDICSLYLFDELKTFIKYVCTLFKRVMYVPGNHEFYLPKSKKGHSLLSKEELDKKLESLEKLFVNLTVLNRKKVVVDGVCIIGCTLWSEIKDTEHTQQRLNRIPMANMSYTYYTEMFQKDLEFLKEVLLKETLPSVVKEKRIIVTHHCPTFKALPESFVVDELTSFYVSDVEYLLSKENTDVWIFGHTHLNVNTELNGVNVITNQFRKSNFACSETGTCQFTQKKTFTL